MKFYWKYIVLILCIIGLHLTKNVPGILWTVSYEIWILYKISETFHRSVNIAQSFYGYLKGRHKYGIRPFGLGYCCIHEPAHVREARVNPSELGHLTVLSRERASGMIVITALADKVFRTGNKMVDGRKKLRKRCAICQCKRNKTHEQPL